MSMRRRKILNPSLLLIRTYIGLMHLAKLALNALLSHLTIQRRRSDYCQFIHNGDAFGYKTWRLEPRKFVTWIWFINKPCIGGYIPYSSGKRGKSSRSWFSLLERPPDSSKKEPNSSSS